MHTPLAYNDGYPPAGTATFLENLEELGYFHN
jgi:hypothetical protein